MVRRVEGTALLVAGHGAIGGTPLDASAVHALGQVGEALLATGASWQVRRLSAAVGERYRADRGTIKHCLDELVAEPVRAAMLVILGVISDGALVTSSELRAYPEDATLPLAWIGERLRACRAEQLLVVLAGKPGTQTRTCLDLLATGRRADVIAVDDSAGAPLIDTLLGGLCGEALDPRTGTVTMKSLSEHLARRVPSATISGSDASQTLAPSPPFGGLWDVRRSQLSRPRAPGGDDDLTGTVLPGRFRIDALIARGTFGTVYRARQLAVERDVAVKVLHADIDPSSEDGRLFVHEIRAVGRIDHAGVVRIFQADITPDGRLFYAMELLDGRDLQQLGTVPRARAIELVRQLLGGLGAAHDAGLVHADVKPANALVVSDRLVLVDFGLARLRAPDRPAQSAGGTPAYMAPEQLNEGRVDARSDLFSAALVLVTLLTGWRRTSAQMLVPPLDAIDDRALRDVLTRALELDPAQRYQSAHELAAALVGGDAPQPASPSPVLPFRLFAPLTEADRGRLHGRETDTAALVEHVLYRRSVIYTAPSGTGKTSLLRAGLVPRLEVLGARVVYLRCRSGVGGDAMRAAIVCEHDGKLVIVLDQVEAADPELIEAVLDAPADADIAIVLAVREDHLARLVARVHAREPGMPILRLPPLGLDGARAAIVGPLAEARLAIDPDLLDVLLADLERAAAAIAPEMGWGDARCVYPPHLQLACSVLYDALGPGEATLALAHYKRLGGFAAIVGEHLERVLDIELAGGDDAIARDVFLALVTGSQERTMRDETELVAIVGAKHGAARVTAVLELLRTRGLLVRVRGEADAGWELVHDGLVPRVLAWIDRRDLARRRAVELVRYHLRRSRPDVPSLLGRDELRELRAHAGAISELDTEWQGRGDGWTPTRLVARSRQVLRRRRLAVAGVLATALAVAGGALIRNRMDESHRRELQSLVDRDLGRFTLELAPFDWDAEHLRATPASAAGMHLAWQLRAPARDDPDSPGELLPGRLVIRGTPELDRSQRELVEARGGRAFLVIVRPGCTDSVLPLVLPGYSTRDRDDIVRVPVPTCAASRAGTVAIAAGPFLFGGGELPSQTLAAYPELAHERRIELPAFLIDRTEVTNAAFALLAPLAKVTGIPAPDYPDEEDFARAGDPDRPVGGITWVEARAFCRFLGKQLPTSMQWERALRGGERLANGTMNPLPLRVVPWGAPITPAPAKLADVGPPGPAPVGTYAGDRSPDGVLDLAGNVMEWTDTQAGARTTFRVTRGGAWGPTQSSDLVLFVGVPNQRPALVRDYTLGARCVYAAD